MENLSRKIIIFILVIVSIVCLVSYFNYLKKQEMYGKFAVYFPDGYFDANDQKFWKISINISEQEIQKMESPNYKQNEQKKMKKLGLNITITDEMISERYKEKKKELEFAKKEMERLAGSKDK